MTLLLFNGQRHVINNVMTLRYIPLPAGTSKETYGRHCPLQQCKFL